MSDLLEKSRVVEVSFRLALPATATREQIEEWVTLHLGRGGMDNNNPLGRYDVEAINRPTLHDTERYLHHAIVKQADGSYRTSHTLQTKPYWGPSVSEVLYADYVASKLEGRGDG